MNDILISYNIDSRALEEVVDTLVQTVNQKNIRMVENWGNQSIYISFDIENIPKNITIV